MPSSILLLAAATLTLAQRTTPPLIATLIGITPPPGPKSTATLPLIPLIGAQGIGPLTWYGRVLGASPPNGTTYAVGLGLEEGAFTFTTSESYWNATFTPPTFRTDEGRESTFECTLVTSDDWVLCRMEDATQLRTVEIPSLGDLFAPVTLTEGLEFLEATPTLTPSGGAEEEDEGEGGNGGERSSHGPRCGSGDDLRRTRAICNISAGLIRRRCWGYLCDSLPSNTSNYIHIPSSSPCFP